MAPLRGDVYFPSSTLPPGSTVRHRCVVLGPNSLYQFAGQSFFVMVALIRSAMRSNGQPVRLIPGHSIPVRQADVPFLTNDSIVETHQLFAVALKEFDPRNQRKGRLPDPILQQVLEGARRLFV